MPLTVAGAQQGELALLAFLKEQKALQPLMKMEGLEQVFLIQAKEGNGKFFQTKAETRAFVFFKMKDGTTFSIPVTAQEKIVLRLKVGGVEHAAQWEMSLQDFFDRKKLTGGTAGEWRASIRSQARNAAIADLPGFTAQDALWLDETLNLREVPLTIDAFRLGGLGQETRIGTLAEGGAARKFLGISPKGWAKRSLLSLFGKAPANRIPSRTASPTSLWFCWQDRLKNLVK